MLAVSTAHGSTLNLWWEPSSTEATVGQTVDIGVFANTPDSAPLALSDAYLAISWDPAVLINATPDTTFEANPWSLSYWSPGNPINANLQDGDAQRELLGQLAPDGPIAPVGTMHDPVSRILVTTFSFTVNAPTAGTSIRLWDTLGTGSTHFYKGDFQLGEWDLALEQGHYAEATISTVPEPATLVGLGVSLAALVRHKRTRGKLATQSDHR